LGDLVPNVEKLTEKVIEDLTSGQFVEHHEYHKSELENIQGMADLYISKACRD